MKIENAIILAAGRGSRMRELTDDRPKCMMEINDKTVIQKTIEVLKYKNINDIIVVTGYKSRILRKHLRSIDKHIKVIKNRHWKKTNSIASMKLASKYLVNSIVIDSDIYINNVDIIKTDVEHSGYTALKDEKPEEWQLENDRQGQFIESVRFKGTYANALPIIDISYWTEEDAKKIKMFINEELRKDKNKFWDEIPLVDYIDKFNLKRYDIEKNDAMEFDTPEELEKVRKIVCLKD